MLIDSGFSKKTVSVKTQPIRSGIARDIRNESIQDYHVIVVGRTGLGKLDDILMGSVSAKLVEITSYISIVVVGEKPETSKILVAFDGSRGSIKSVKCIGSLLDQTFCEVMLCHVIRPLNAEHFMAKKLFNPKYEDDWIEAGKRRIVPAINKAQRRLMQAGFPEERISSEILTYEKSRAAAIVKAAGTVGYDTIVLGRRGFTSVGEFNIGRVSRKILHLTFQPALWIVS